MFRVQRSCQCILRSKYTDLRSVKILVPGSDSRKKKKLDPPVQEILVPSWVLWWRAVFFSTRWGGVLSIKSETTIVISTPRGMKQWPIILCRGSNITFCSERSLKSRYGLLLLLDVTLNSISGTLSWCFLLEIWVFFWVICQYFNYQKLVSICVGDIVATSECYIYNNAFWTTRALICTFWTTRALICGVSVFLSGWCFDSLSEFYALFVDLASSNRKYVRRLFLHGRGLVDVLLCDSVRFVSYSTVKLVLYGFRYTYFLLFYINIRIPLTATSLISAKDIPLSAHRVADVLLKACPV